MIGLPARTRVWIVAGHTDMRKGFDGLSATVQTAIDANPFCGHVFVFRGKRGDMLKVLWFGVQGLLSLSKRLERGSVRRVIVRTFPRRTEVRGNAPGITPAANQRTAAHGAVRMSPDRFSIA